MRAFLRSGMAGVKWFDYSVIDPLGLIVHQGCEGRPLAPSMEATMHHKRGRARNQRAGCKLCKPWKANGVRTERIGGERFSDHRRRIADGEMISG